MKVFVDVGSHIGHTIEEVVKPEWGFDEIHAIEPMPGEFAALSERFGRTAFVNLHRFALAERSGTLTMYGDNAELEASVWAAKRDADENFRTEVRCVCASDFFSELPDGANLTVNMNCEGGEVAILDDLLFTGEVERITHLMVDFDIRKVVGQEHHERRLRDALDEAGVSYTAVLPERETHQEQIAAWLEAVL